MGVPYIKVRLFSVFSLSSSLFSFFYFSRHFTWAIEVRGIGKIQLSKIRMCMGNSSTFWLPGLQNLVLYGRKVCMACLLLNKKVCKAFQNCNLFCYLLVTFAPGYIYITCFGHTYFMSIKIYIWMST